MRCLLFASLFFALLLASVSSLTLQKGLLFEATCKMTAAIAPGTPYELSVDFSNALLPWFAASKAIIKGRAKCYCPDLTDAQFEQSILNPSDIGFWRRLAAANLTDESLFDLNRCGANAQYFRDYVDMFRNIRDTLASNNINLYLPPSASIDKLQSNDGARFAVTLPGLLQLVFIVGRCPLGNPWAQVYCSGESCANVFNPCNVGETCGSNLTCTAIKDTYGRPLVTEDFLFNLTKSINVYDDVDLFPGCQPVGTIFARILDFFRRTFFIKTPSYAVGTAGEVRVCLPPNFLVNATSFLPVMVPVPVRTITVVEGRNVTMVVVRNVTLLENSEGPIIGATIDTSTARSTTPTVLITSFQPITEGSKVLLKTDCTGSVHLFPGNAAEQIIVKAPIVRALLDDLNAINYDTQKCRAMVRGEPLTDASFKVAFGHVESWLWQLIRPLRTYVPIPSFSNWLLKNPPDRKILMPESFTYDNWVNKSHLSLRFAALTSLLGTDISLNLLVTRCAGSVLPQIHLECEGDGCRLFKPQSCVADSECPNGMYCKNFFTHLNLTDVYNRDIISLYAADTVPTACRDPQLAFDDFQTAINYASGKTQVAVAGDVNNAKICLFNPPSKEQFDAWTSTLVDTSMPGVIQMRSFQEWKEGSATVVSSATTTAVSVGMVVLFLLFSILMM